MNDLDLLTPAEAGLLMECSELTVRRMLRAGKMPGLKIGRGWVIPRGALTEFLSSLALKEWRERNPRPPRKPGRPRIPLTPII